MLRPSRATFAAPAISSSAWTAWKFESNSVPRALNARNGAEGLSKNDNAIANLATHGGVVTEAGDSPREFD